LTTAVILAGGLGTRLRSVVPDLPKPMAPIKGRPFLERQMDFWIGQGVNRFVLSVGYLSELIMDHFGVDYQGVPIEYAVEEKPLGTGGGLLMAARHLGKDPALVLNGDTFFEVSLDQLRQFHSANQAAWTFALFRANEAERFMGMDIRGDGKVISLKSGTTDIGRLANGGVYLVNPDVLQSFCFSSGDKVSLEDDILKALLQQGELLYGLEFSGRFIDIGVPDDYQRAASVMKI